MVVRRLQMIKNISGKAALCILLSACVIGFAIASGGTVAFYRDQEGNVDANAKADGKLMSRKVREDGVITLWITTGIPFNLRFSSMSEEEVAEQNARVRESFSEILDPLVNAGSVWHPESGPFIKGPGCTVRADKDGLKALLRDDRLIQIVATDFLD